MTRPILPDAAFLPKHTVSAQERQAFLARRNRMFALCTPAEQQCLTELAHWYATVKLDLLAKPNLFTESYAAWFKHRYSLGGRPKLHPIVFGLSKVHSLIHRIERWLGARAQSRLLARMRSLAGRDGADKLVALIHFFRLLPLDFGFLEKSAFEKRLDALLQECLTSRRISALRRFDAVRRCAAWSYENHQYVAHDAGLRKHAWPLLLEVAQADVASAARLVDAHWNQTRPPHILSTLHLHERSELAYQLAVVLKPHHADFAADMLCALVSDASHQVKKMSPAAAEVLTKIIEASCQLLAAWTFAQSCTSSKSALLSIDRLLQFGDPQADYWPRLAPEALALMRGLAPAELNQRLRLLAQVVFYSGDSALASEALALFEGCMARRLDVQGDWEWVLMPAIHDVSQSLSILEDKVLSMRNRHIRANPNHPLLHAVETQLQIFLERLQAAEPASALSNSVALTLTLSNETLVRKHHRILREEFAVRAHANPADAGLALKQMIQYCGYSQTQDEIYRKHLCKESFNVLLPLLESVSSTDAAVARTGIGWSPRGNI